VDATDPERPKGPVAGASPRVPRRGPAAGASAHARLGVALATLFALVLSAARIIDVSEDGKLMMAFSLAFFPALVAAAVSRPLWFMLLTVAYLPFAKAYPLSLGGITGANMSNIVLLLAPLAWLSSRRRSRRRLRAGALEALVGLYMVVGTLALLPAVGQADSLGSLLQTYRGWLAPFLVFFVARGLVRDRVALASVLRLMATVTIMVAFLTWIEGLSRSDRGSIEASRVSGLMQQANQMGAFLVYYGIVLLALSLRERRLATRLFFLGGFLAAARAMLFTFSRSAYIALASGASLVVLLYNPLLLIAGAGGGVVAVTVKPSLIPGSIRERLGQTTEGVGLEGEKQSLDKSSAYRLILWKAAFRMIRERPLSGVGLGQFSSVVGHYTEVTLSKEDPNDAHNAFILIAAEMGLPALASAVMLLLALELAAAKAYLRRRHRVDRTIALAFLGSWVGLVVSCMLGSRFSDESLISYFWILAALVAVVRRLPEGSARRQRA
jgi:O-antigen ligase